MRERDASNGPNREPPPDSGPPARAPADEGPLAADDSATAIGDPSAAPSEALCPNPSCQQPVDSDERFCQACGTVVVATEAEDEKTRPWFALATVAFLLLAAAGFIFLYANAFAGRR